MKLTPFIRHDDPCPEPEPEVSHGKQILFAMAMAGLTTLAAGVAEFVVDHLRKRTGLDPADDGDEEDDGVDE